MQPSARSLVECVTWALEHKVAPVVDDPWAASSLRSVHCLLLHLADRVEREGPMLFEDNDDCRGTLREVAPLLADLGASDAAAAATVSADLPWPAEGYPSVAVLGQENERLRGAVDAALRVALDRRPDGDTALGVLDALLRRRLLREQPMLMPAFLGSPF